MIEKIREKTKKLEEFLVECFIVDEGDWDEDEIHQVSCEVCEITAPFDELKHKPDCPFTMINELYRIIEDARFKS